MRRLGVLVLVTATACTPVVNECVTPGARCAVEDAGAGSMDAGVQDAGAADGGEDAGVVDAGPPCDASCDGCCIDGRCVPFDEQSPDFCGARGARCRPCSLAETCAPRGCVSLINPDAGPIGGPGAPCASDVDCGSDTLGDCFKEFDSMQMYTGWHGGYCSRECVTTACPEGSTCVGGWCFRACSSSTECRARYECYLAPGDEDAGTWCAPIR